jgi:hypothetical protein
MDLMLFEEFGELVGKIVLVDFFWLWVLAEFMLKFLKVEDLVYWSNEVDL